MKNDSQSSRFCLFSDHSVFGSCYVGLQICSSDPISYVAVLRIIFAWQIFFFYLGVSENFELWLQNIFDNVIYFYERIDFMKVIYVIQCNLMYYLFQVPWANLVNLNKKKRWVWSRPRKNFWRTCTHYPINTWKHRY